MMSIGEQIKSNVGWVSGVFIILAVLAGGMWWAVSIEGRLSALESQTLVRLGVSSNSNTDSPNTSNTSEVDSIKNACAKLALDYADKTKDGSEYFSGGYHVKEMMKDLGCIDE